MALSWDLVYGQLRGSFPVGQRREVALLQTKGRSWRVPPGLLLVCAEVSSSNMLEPDHINPAPSRASVPV